MTYIRSLRTLSQYNFSLFVVLLLSTKPTFLCLYFSNLTSLDIFSSSYTLIFKHLHVFNNNNHAISHVFNDITPFIIHVFNDNT